MKLTKLRARNFKGLSFELDLKAINFLIGSNFSGKSARTDAIRLLLLGYLPELGKLPRATFGLSSGTDMEVSGEFDTGEKIRRTWRLKGDAVKTEEEFFQFDFSAEKVGQLAVMLNAETYFALSDRERVNYVFANVSMDGAGFVVAGLFESLREGLADAEKEPVAAFIAKLRAKSSPTTSPQDQIAAFLEIAAAEAKAAKEYAARMEKTTQGLAALRAQEEAGVDIGALDVRRTRLNREIEDLQAEKAKHAAAYELSVTSRKRRETLRELIAGRASFETRQEAARARREEIQARIAALSGMSESELDQLRSDERTAAIALTEHNAQLRQVGEAILRNEAELGEVHRKEKCPYCGATGETWKGIKTAEISSALAGLRVKKEQLVQHIAVVSKAHDDLLARFNDARAASQRLNTEKIALIPIDKELALFEQHLAKIKAAEDEAAHLPSEDRDVMAAVDAAQLGLNAKYEELRVLDNQRRAALARENDLKRLAEAERERDKAKAELFVATEAAKVLRKLQSQMVEDAFRPLLDTANRFFGNILKFPIAYHDGEIGAWREGVWVGHRTFSGTEKALCYAAIQAALAANSPVKIMLIDELGRLDQGNATLLVEAVAMAVQSRWIDQFVGIDAANRYVDLTGATADAPCQVLEVG